MTATIDINGRPKRVLMVASNPSTSDQTGWPIGFWWAELTHPYWEFTERGYEVTVASPDGGALVADSFSDPEDESQYAANDLLSLGFKSSPRTAALVEATPPIAEIDPDDGWTARTVDGALSAQFEHTIEVTADGVRVLTVQNDSGAWEPPGRCTIPGFDAA